jgi:hypothetical protein
MRQAYSEARLYKGASLALLSLVGYHTFYRQHLRGGKESRPQQHTWNSEFFVLSRSKYLLHLVHISKISKYHVQSGLEKTRVLKKKPAQWFFLGYLVFLVFFNICREARV